MWLYGDFNNWSKFEHPLKKLDFGKWELVLPPTADGECRVKHMSIIKLVVKTQGGEIVDR